MNPEDFLWHDGQVTCILWYLNPSPPIYPLCCCAGVVRRTNLMVEADNAAKAVDKARPNREEAAKAIRYSYILTRVEWFSFLKMDQLLPIRPIFRSSIPKIRQVWPRGQAAKFSFQKNHRTLKVYIFLFAQTILFISKNNRQRENLKLKFCSYNF